MSKFTFNRIASLVNAPTAINGVITQIESAFNSLVSRDGTAPNQMTANLDMNSKRIINLPAPGSDFEPARMIDLLSVQSGALTLLGPQISIRGGVLLSSTPSHNFVTGINSNGDVQYARPSFADLSDSIAATQLIAPGASTFGGVKSSSAPSNQFATGIDTSGNVTYAPRPQLYASSFGVLANSNGTHGNGADDTAAIQSAVDAAGAIGADLIFPRGICRITSTINLSSTNRIYRLRGVGYASQIFNDATAATPTFTASYPGGSAPISLLPCVSIEGLNFIQPNNSAVGNCAVLVTGNQHFRFVGNYVSSNYIGIYATTSYSPEIIGNTFTSMANNAVLLAADSTANGLQFVGNRLFANGITTSVAAVNIGGPATAVNFIGNDIESNYAGVQFSGAINSMVFTGNFIEAHTSHNVYFSTTAQKVTMTNNDFGGAGATTLDMANSTVANNSGSAWTVTWSGSSTGNVAYNNPAGWATPPSSVSLSGGNVATNALSVAAPTTKTANYTVDSGTAKDFSVIFNGAGSLTVTLPTASSWPGRVIRVKTVAAQTVVSASSNVVPLTGGAAGTAILAATAGKWAELQSDGTNWIVMAGN